MNVSMYNIEKLNETNYDSWSLQIKGVSIRQDLWSAISDDKPTAADQIAAWTKRDEKATSTTILSITPVRILYINNCLSASAAWNALREVHRPNVTGRLHFLNSFLICEWVKQSPFNNMFVIFRQLWRRKPRLE